MPDEQLVHERVSDIGAASTLAPPSPAWALVQLLRPRQWMKNGLVFAALLFSEHLRDATSTWLTVLAFASFCLASSAVYAMNDLLDASEDRLHPKKRLRPVALGVITPAQAGVAAVVLAAGSLALAAAISLPLAAIVGLYLGVNLLYSFWLKHLVLLDVMAVALGFVLRAVGGAVVIHVQLSLWFLVCVPLLSLFLAVAKRRHELVTIAGAENHRRVLTEYTPQLLDQMLAILSTALITAYLLYAKDTARPYEFMLTSPLVIYGVFRYLYLVYRHAEGGSPDEVVLADVPMLVTVGLWVVAVILIIYAA